MAFRIGSLLICGVLFSACIGCKEEGVPKYPVTGSLIYKSKPLEGAVVSFTPKSNGRPASAITDSNGKYSLSTDVSDDGALADEYTVTIAKYDRTVAELPIVDAASDDAEDVTEDAEGVTDEYPAGYNEMEASEKSASIAKNLLPLKFADPGRSPLVVQVKESPEGNVFDFNLDKL
jgi:hypothetical protein